MARQQLENDINTQQGKIQRAEQQFNRKLQEVQRAKGDGFQQSTQMAQIQADVAQIHHKHYLNALSTILNEFPDFAQMIDGVLQESGIQVPSRPQTPSERPSTNQSQRSGQQA